MAQVPGVTMDDLEAWYTLKDRMAKDKAAEAMLRARIFAHFFPNPTEGTNRFSLPDGYSLKADHKLNRKVLEDEVDKLKEEIKREGSNLPKLPFSKLIKYKPEVSITEYRKLSEDDRAVFDRCLEIKPGMPDMSIDQPKRGG